MVGSKRVWAVLLLVTACACGAYLFATSAPGRYTAAPLKLFISNEESYEWDTFEQWVNHHGKSYSGWDDLLGAFRNFHDNTAAIRVHNQQGYGYTLAVNHFGDLSHDEFKKFYCGTKVDLTRKRNVIPTNDAVSVPESVDWTTKGAVTPVQNQGQCGSCWAFSTIAGLEGAYFLKTGNLKKFSEQQLVDCSGSFGNQGCNGGLMDYGFQYLEQYKAELETDYPYTAQDGTCKYDASLGVVSDSNYVDVDTNEAALKVAVAQRPVSVAIEADHMSFQFYSGGVYDGNCGTQLDHGVTAVGYGSDGGKLFWKVKNSWGAGWGESGYIRMIRTESSSSIGQCGIASSASYPIV